jgi:LmbE family N-acetylglucosaminyl deacetylase
MITMRLIRPKTVAALGAHCDDIAIRAGTTLLFMCAANPGLRVDVLVLSGGGTERADEEQAALAAFCPSADLRINLLKFRTDDSPRIGTRPRRHWSSCVSRAALMWSSRPTGSMRLSLV